MIQGADLALLTGNPGSLRIEILTGNFNGVIFHHCFSAADAACSTEGERLRSLRVSVYNMKKIGFIGWRGMVGSVLMNRMVEEHDFVGFESHFFSTSQAGQKAPDFAGTDCGVLLDAGNLDLLKEMDIIVTCQGGGYTTSVYDKLLASGWKGYWIDSASTLRQDPRACIILDPVNREVIDRDLDRGIHTFVGGNCTTSIMLMALAGLIKSGAVEWLQMSSYQAASGAGAKNMRELLAQMGTLYGACAEDLKDPAASILKIEKEVRDAMNSPAMPVAEFTVPLAGSLIPWIDKKMESGQSREEWKGQVETNKILGFPEGKIKVDGNCVRISSLRCHSESFLIKLAKDITVPEIEEIIRNTNEWVKVIPNEKEETIRELSPAKVSGSLSVPIGRIRKTTIGDRYLSAFCVGDQLLWGAAEPLRRMLKILLGTL